MKLSKMESRKIIFPCRSQKNREWKENCFLPFSKIESRRRNGTYQFFEIDREISLSTLDFSPRARLLSMPDIDLRVSVQCEKKKTNL